MGWPLTSASVPGAGAGVGCAFATAAGVGVGFAAGFAGVGVVRGFGLGFCPEAIAARQRTQSIAAINAFP